jgi:hypothetical protein
MVSMVRALIADPDLVLKAREGHEELIRPCTSSGQGCVARLMVGQQISCVVNVAASAELRIPSDTPQPGPDRKRVVIVGAGLAGLEAARTAALRGHDVTLLEMRSEVGGQALIASMAPGRGDTRAIISWLAQELDRLSVRVKLGTVVDDDLLLGLAPDDVIMATGSAPRRDGRQLDPPGRELPGAQLPHVATSWAVFGFGGSADISGRVLVYDDLAGHEGLAVCDHVAAHGAGLVYVTRHASLASGVDAPETTAMRSIERVLGAGAEVIGYATLLEIGPAQARVRYRGTGRVRTIAADAVVRVGVNEPETGLAGILSDSGLRIQLVGDANGSRDWMSAIHDGHKAALAL